MLMGVHVNKTAILLLVAAALTLLFIYYPSVSSDKESELSRVEAAEKLAKDALLEDKLRVIGGTNDEEKALNMTWDDIKAQARQNTKLKLTEGKFEMRGLGQVYRRECENTEQKSSGTLLLLHGMSFNSETWKDLGTLHVMANYGYRVVAIDIPGFKNTLPMDIKDKGEFLINLMLALDIDKPIVVSPSMSGGWSLPLVLKHRDAVTGYVPVAPVSTGDYKNEEYESNNVPALIVYGDKDTNLGTTSAAKLTLLPNGQVHKLIDAGHACYLNQPQEFHRLLQEFCAKLFAN